MMDESDAHDAAIERLTETVAADMRNGEYTDELWTEILRMLLSKERCDLDGVEDMTLSDIIGAAADKLVNSRAYEGIVGEVAEEIAQEEMESDADRAYEMARNVRMGL